MRARPSAIADMMTGTTDQTAGVDCVVVAGSFAGRKGEMARKCSICELPQRHKIDAQLAIGAGTKRRIASDNGISERALYRHEHHCLDPQLVEAAKGALSAESSSLVARVTKMVDRLERTADKCEDHGTYKDLLAVARELRPYHELFGKANGQLATDKVNALFINLGVKSQDELESRLAVTRQAEEAKPAQVVLEACEVLEKVWRTHPDLRTLALERLNQSSYAVEVNGNGKVES